MWLRVVLGRASGVLPDRLIARSLDHVVAWEPPPEALTGRRT